MIRGRAWARASGRDVVPARRARPGQVQPIYFTLRWLTLMLTQELMMPDVLRLWDALLSDMARPRSLLLYICVAMVQEAVAPACSKSLKPQSGKAGPCAWSFQVFESMLRLRGAKILGLETLVELVGFECTTGGPAFTHLGCRQNLHCSASKRHFGASGTAHCWNMPGWLSTHHTSLQTSCLCLMFTFGLRRERLDLSLWSCF